MLSTFLVSGFISVGEHSYLHIRIFYISRMLCRRAARYISDAKQQSSLGQYETSCLLYSCAFNTTREKDVLR